jgi:proteasome lid subunit RPN8/RPN11
MILISKKNINKILEHAKKTYPFECCGILVGKTKEKKILDVYKLKNLNKDEPRQRYEIDPYEFYKIDKIAKKNGMDVIGFYHSHPDYPSLPSNFDKQKAWEGYLYLIVSLKNSQIKAWIFDDKKKDFFEEEITYI